MELGKYQTHRSSFAVADGWMANLRFLKKYMELSNIPKK